MKDDLISRSALLKEFEWLISCINAECTDVEDAMERIKKAPAVDAEVVRCKDCKHFNHTVIDDDPAETFEVDICLHKDLFPTRVTPDFYCAHGAKMDAEVEG